VEEILIESETYSRNAWVWGDEGATNLCLFLDAELYMDRVNAHAVFQALELPDTACLFLSNQDAGARHHDYVCNAEFSAFVTSSVMTEAKRRFPALASGGHTICGLSLSGLAAAYLGVQHPAVFSRVLSQSGSFWWNNEWFADNVPETSSRFWVSVGDEELESGVTHPPTGLVQNVCQFDSVKRAADALWSNGAKLHLHTYFGGHDAMHWNDELRGALGWLYQN
jgi:iron(III)-enterobactin esterase